MNLAQTEKMMFCPYQKSHRISKWRFNFHVSKCRRDYIAKEIMAGEPLPPKFTCQYNHAHAVYGPELDYHEENCDDRGKNVRGYQLEVEPWIEYYGAGGDMWRDYNLKNYAPDEAEHQAIFAGTSLGKILGGGFIEEQSIDHFKNLTAEEIEDMRRLFRKKYVDQRLVRRTTNVEEAVGIKDQPPPAKESDSENEEWAMAPTALTTGPNYDYPAYIWSGRFQRDHSRMPTCLTKMEKQLYLKVHGSRMGVP